MAVETLYMVHHVIDLWPRIYRVCSTNGVSVKPSRFNPTPVQRLQQGMMAKAILKVKACHVPEGLNSIIATMPGPSFADIEQRIMTTMMKYFDAATMGLTGTNSNVMPVSEPYQALVPEYTAPPPVVRVCSPRGTGYGEWKFDHRIVKDRAQRVAKDLPAIMARLGADHIVVHGTSGTMIAPVLLYLMPELKIVMIRKSGEGSHGNRIEGPYGNFLKGLMVDDFIASGSTLREVIKRHDCEVVGILCHSNADPLAQLRVDSSNDVAKFYYM